MRRHVLMVVVSGVVLALLAGTAAAAQPVVELVPPDALGFATAHHLGQANGKLEALGRKMQVPIPSLLDLAKKQTGITAGLDEQGDATLLAMPGKDSNSPPIVVVAVPVTDYAAFLGQFESVNDAGKKIAEVTVKGTATLVAAKGDYALLAEPENRDTLKAVLADHKGPCNEVKALGDWIAENDASLVITPKGVKLISEKIQEGLREIQATFQDIQNQDAEMGANFRMMGPVLAMYEQFAAALGKEVATLSFGVQLPDDGTVLGLARVQAVAGGGLDRATRHIKRPVDNLLAGIPLGPYVVAGGMTIPEGLVESMTKLSGTIYRAAPGIYGIPDDKIDEVVELNTAAMQGFRGMSMALGVGEPGSPIYGNFSGTMFVDDAEKYLDTYHGAIDGMRKLAGDETKSILSGMKVEPMEIDGRKALRLKMSFSEMLPMADMPEMARMFDALYGPGGRMQFFMAVAGDKTVAFGSTKTLLKQSMKSLAKGGLDEDTQLRKTAARLLPGAQAVGYWSVPGTIALVNRAIPALAPPTAAQFKLPPFPDTPPLGYAAQAADGRIDMQMVVPAEVLQSVMGYFIQVQMMQMQQQQLENAPADEI